MYQKWSAMRTASPVVSLCCVLAAAPLVAAEATPTTADPERTKAAQEWCDLTLKYAEGIEALGPRGSVYGNLAYTLAKVGDLDAAQAAAAKLENPAQSVAVYIVLAGRYKALGDEATANSLMEKARELALSTTKAASDPAIFGQLIRAYAAMDMPGEAQSVARALPNTQYRDQGFWILASELARQGNLGRARGVVTTRISEESRAPAMAEVAFACADGARVDDTKTVVSELTNREWRNRAYSILVEALAKKGRWTPAEEAANQISSANGKLQAKTVMLIHWGNDHDIDEIAARLGTVSTREEKLALYKKLVEKLTAADRIDEAEAAIKEMFAIIKKYPRQANRTPAGIMYDGVYVADAASNYLGIAKRLSEQGQQAAAQRRIDWAGDAILRLSPLSGLGKGLLALQLVRTQVDIGDLKGARRSVGLLEEQFRGLNAATTAGGYVKAGDVPAALEMIAIVPKEPRKNRSEFLRPVVEELIRTGELSTAKQVVAEFGDSVDESAIYRGVGNAMVGSGRDAELRQWLPDMPSDLARAYATMGAAEALNGPATAAEPATPDPAAAAAS